MKTLNMLTVEQVGTVESISGETEHAIRLLALGFTPGSEVTIFKKTIFGGPCVYSVQDSKIALRSNDAALIHVSLN
ncbi:ferrous iron transport protein A [bacterium]|nr:ferrous iron transport protein A [bacterium]